MLFIFIFVGITSIATAEEYFIDINSIGGTCNNNGPGTETEPWCSWSKIFWDKRKTLEPGDIVHIREGVYYERFHFNSRSTFSGTKEKPILIRSYEGERVVFDGSKTGGNGLYIPGDNSYIHVVGPIEIRNFSKALETSTSLTKYGWVLDNLDVHHCGRGLLLRKFDGIAVTNSVIHHNNGYGEAGGVFMYYGTTNALIQNVIAHSNNDGRGSSGDGDGFWADETAGTIKMENVVAYGNSEDGFDLKAINVSIVNGKAYDNTTCGAKLWFGHYDIENFVAYNNGEDGLKLSEANVNLKHVVSVGNGESGLQFRYTGSSGKVSNSVFSGNKLTAVDIERLRSGKTFSVQFSNNIYHHPSGNVINTSSCKGYDYTSAEIEAGQFDRDLKSGINCGSSYPKFFGSDVQSSSRDNVLKNAPNVFKSNSIAAGETGTTSVGAYIGGNYSWQNYTVGSYIELNNDNVLRRITRVARPIIYFENDPLITPYGGDKTTGKGVRIVDWGGAPFDLKDNYNAAENSAATNAGVLIADVHCPKADDDPVSPMDPDDDSCFHWSGTAPDIGVKDIGTHDWSVPMGWYIAAPKI